MNRISGAAAILVSCFLAAIMRLRSQKERIRFLRALETSLLELRGELVERRRGLGEIFLLLANKNDEAVGRFYETLCDGLESLGERSFSEIWRASAEISFSTLGENCLDALLPLGVCLGGSELELQCAALESAARRIADTARTEKESLAAERKLSIGISLSAGAFLVIILM